MGNPCEEEKSPCQVEKKPECQQGPRGPDRKHWNTCIFGSFITVSTGIILGTIGTIIMASELPVVVGTGVGVSLAAAVCGKSLTKSPPVDEYAECDRDICAEDYMDPCPKTKQKKCFCGCNSGMCGVKQTSCVSDPDCKTVPTPAPKEPSSCATCSPPSPQPSSENECDKPEEPSKSKCVFEIEVDGYRCTCSCTPIEYEKEVEKNQSECPSIPCPTK